VPSFQIPESVIVPQQVEVDLLGMSEADETPCVKRVEPLCLDANGSESSQSTHSDAKESEREQSVDLWAEFSDLQSSHVATSTEFKETTSENAELFSFEFSPTHQPVMASDPIDLFSTCKCFHNLYFDLNFFKVI
jgi:hypothetical protein